MHPLKSLSSVICSCQLTRSATAKGEDWGKLAKEYKGMASGPNAQVNKVMFERLNTALPFSQATAILDNGCGPGPVISGLIAAHAKDIPESTPFLAADFGEAMIEQVLESKKQGMEAGDNTWERVETRVLNAMDMQGVPDSSHSHITAGFVYFMTPDPQKCLSESLRILQPGGVLAVSSWEGSEWLDIMKTLKLVRPDKVLPGLPENWSRVDLMKAELETAGFIDARTERVPVTMRFEDRDSFIDMLLTKMPHMVDMLQDMSTEEIAKLREVATDLSKKLSPESPGILKGMALLAVGRK
jgi:ubiquinone/menaquinone biosynthesis C-methylase UbiE